MKSNEFKLFRVFAVLRPDRKDDTISLHLSSLLIKFSGLASVKISPFTLKTRMAGLAVVLLAQFNALSKLLVK